MNAIETLESKLPSLGAAVRGKPNVVGYGIGYKRKDGKRTDQLVFVVFVAKKLNVAAENRIPATVDGVPTDVIESGEFAPTTIRPHSGRCRPA